VTRKYKESGGELRLRCGVRRLRHDGRRVVEVELDSGECLGARQVLSSAGLCETLRLCDPPLVDRPMPHPGAISFVEAIFSLGAVQPVQIGIPHTITFFNNDPRGFRYGVPDDPVDVSSGIICSPNNFQYDAPLDEGMLRLTALAQPRYWLTPRGEEEYQAEKERWRARMVDAARRWIPDFTSYVVDVDMFTPRTIVKYTGHENGAVYGAPHKELQGRTPLENLFVCGTDQGFLGITGSMLSGITIANLHLLRASN
jgi:phytoene dehydrogenase-like protein